MPPIINSNPVPMNPAGRPKGSLNKFGSDVRTMIITALSEAGGVAYLVECAKAHPAAFLALLGRVLPTTLSSQDGSPIHLHLLAATQVSGQLLEEPRQPPTIDVKPQLHDAPLPLE